MRVKLATVVLVVMALAYAMIWAWHEATDRARAFAEDLVVMNGEHRGTETSRTPYNFDLGGAKRLVIANDLGSVEVTAASGSKVMVEQLTYSGQDDNARALAKRFSVVSGVEKDGGLKISVKTDADRRARRRVRVKLVAQVPPEVSLRVEVASGGIDVAGMNRDVAVDTGSGEISVSNVRGAVVAHTGSGEINASNLWGGIRADTGSGGVDLKMVRGRTTAESGSGGLTLSDVEADEISASTASGSVELEDVWGNSINADSASGGVSASLKKPFSGRMDLRTSSGGVELRLPANSDCVINAHTSSGGIDNSLPLRSEVSKEGELAGTLGSGKGRVEVSSDSGGITLEAAGAE